MRKKTSKKAIGKTTLVTIIVLVAIVIGAIVVSNAIGFVMDGLLSFLGPSGASLNKVHSLTESVCSKPDAILKSTIVVPKGHKIMITDYNLSLIGSYDECMGGTCMCILKDTWTCDPQDPKDCEPPANYYGPRYLQVPPSSRYRYCKPLSVPKNEPIYCCIFGDCEFRNVADIANLGSCLVNSITPYNGLTFIASDVIWEKSSNVGSGEHAYFCSLLAGANYVRTEYSQDQSSVVCCYSTKELSGQCQNILDYDAGEINMSLDGLPEGQYKVRIERILNTQLGYTAE